METMANDQEQEQQRNQDNKPKKPKESSAAFLWILLVFAAAGFAVYHFWTLQDETMLYSEFKTYLRQGKIQRVFIGDASISGELKQLNAKKEPFTFRTLKIDDPALLNELETNGIEYSGKEGHRWISDAITWGLILVIGMLILILLFRWIGPGSSVMAFGKSRAKFYEEDEIKISFNDVAGIDEAKEELKEVVEFLKSSEKFQKLGGKIPKGVLLVGAPGTGKTLLARAVAGEAKAPFFSMSGSDFVEMFVGVGASRVRDLFKQASEHAPCIIFIDELDALGKARGISMGGHDEREQTLNQLLVEMDGFEPNTGVIIMAATNRPEILDPALLRAGRFDRQIAVARPDVKGREAILTAHSKNVKLSADVDLRVIASRTPGFVGADLANIINEAALLAARRNKESVGMAELDEAIDRIVGGLEKKNRVISAKEKKIVAYHEAGHAIVSETVPTADPVHKISIIPRGIAALGYTQQLPTDDRYLMTKSELEDKLCVLLGGRVAEEIIFHDISTGAQSDLQRATDIARSMVTEYGMSAKLGLRTFENERRSLLLDSPFVAAPRDYSDEKARQIDEEVEQILDRAHKRVHQMLIDQRDLLEQVHRLLLEQEVVDGERLRQMMGKQASDAATH